jgi:hypothetical protein
VAITAGGVSAAFLLITGPLYSVLGVDGSSQEPAELLLPAVAASYIAHPERFSTEDIRLLEEVAPPGVWVKAYDCLDGTGLLFHPEFDRFEVVRKPGEYRELVVRTTLRDPVSVFADRGCSSSFLFLPPQPDDEYFHRPPYEIPTNAVGLERSPISARAFSITAAVWRWAEEDEVLWLTWRPAIVLVPALTAVMFFALLPNGRRFLLPSALLVIHAVNVALTSPTPEFRFAFPLYLVSVLTPTLLWPALATGEHSRASLGGAHSEVL